MLVVILLLTAVAAFAQTEGARISGRVTDLTGAVIAGAECTITNIETNVSSPLPPMKTEFMSYPSCVRPPTD